MRLTGNHCCGRAAMSLGLVARARRQLRSLIDLVEDLLVEAIDDGRLVLAAGHARQILFHGHCHQKAEVGTRATVELLRRIPGTTVRELDAGCCGMAGSFGFEAEHYDLSMRIGEDRLFPALRAADATTLVAATGVSCRRQITHATARHPVQLLLETVERGMPNVG